MSAHDKRTWELFEACARAEARRDQYAGLVSNPRHKNSIQYASFVRSLEEFEAKLENATRSLDAHEENYTGWARFWCVPQGHIHRSRHCSTCNKNGKPTQFFLAHEVSGMDEEAAVKAQGPVLCTVCFPSAPLDWTNGLEKAAEERKASKCQAGPYDYKDASAPNRMYRYATCNVCGGRPSLTSTGKMRSHRPGV